MQNKATTAKLPDEFRNGLRITGFTRLSDIPAKCETVFIVQRCMLTMIETSITRGEAVAMAHVLARHFDLTESELSTGYEDL